jgi:hypothetical protein
MWVMMICTLHYNFVDWLKNIQHNRKNNRRPHELIIVRVITTSPRLVGYLLAIESLMFEVVPTNYMFYKSTNEHNMNKMSYCI